MQFLDDQDRELTAQIDAIVSETNPALRVAYGIGSDVAVQLNITAGANPERLRNEAFFAALCGVAPGPASSCKTSRHRLSRGGDRPPTVPSTASTSSECPVINPPAKLDTPRT